MKKDKYKYSKITLKFFNFEIESLYHEYILKKALFFNRIAWGLVIFLGSSFALLDRQIFGEKSDIVQLARLIIVAFSVLIISSTFNKKLWKYQDWNAFFLILIIGLFCIFLIAISDPKVFTPYFTGLFFADPAFGRIEFLT